MTGWNPPIPAPNVATPTYPADWLRREFSKDAQNWGDSVILDPAASIITGAQAQQLKQRQQIIRLRIPDECATRIGVSLSVSPTTVDGATPNPSPAIAAAYALITYGTRGVQENRIIEVGSGTQIGVVGSYLAIDGIVPSRTSSQSILQGGDIPSLAAASIVEMRVSASLGGRGDLEPATLSLYQALASGADETLQVPIGAAELAFARAPIGAAIQIEMLDNLGTVIGEWNFAAGSAVEAFRYPLPQRVAFVKITNTNATASECVLTFSISV